MEATSESVPLWHLAVLAAVQGVTEFLPISSSAHLILVPYVAGWKDQGLLLDVAMHMGSLLAVVLYFRKDVRRLVYGGVEAVRGKSTPDSMLALQIILATLPVVLAGYFLHDAIASDWRSPVLIATTTAGFALVLWAADRRADRAQRTLGSLAFRDALLIGLAQALALVPGVSRSGITMTMALFLGLQRQEAARFSLLLSIPTTAAAGALGIRDMLQSGETTLYGHAVVGAVMAFFCAYIAISGLMTWLRSATFTPFVIYRIGLAVAIVLVIL